MKQLTIRKSISRLESRKAQFEALRLLWEKSLAQKVRAGDLSPRSADTYKVGVRWFLDWVADKPEAFENITLWRGYLLSEKGYSVNTVKTLANGVRDFILWGIEHGAMDPKLLSTFGKSRRGTGHQVHLREPLTNQEVLDVLNSVDPASDIGKRDAAIMAVLAYCGARQSDIVNANLHDLHWNGRRYKLDIIGKGRVEPDESLLILSPGGIESVKRYLTIRNRMKIKGDDPLFVNLGRLAVRPRMSTRTVRALVKKYYRKSGIPDNKTTHGIRHRFALNALEHGAPLDKIQQAMRHMNIETTMIYLRSRQRETNPAESYIDYEKEDK
ncbi:MAG: hypothetical protein B7Z62_07860 [Deltaproteobacteria bacterium 37-65-8]|nr:MAG: hypothetical protein B7Z62_07860 [Deltaproteobacteria bacterium 37-65-8]HQT90421.1 tyrosine-type recombinase/integrase [Candidatus Kryptobacter bacterium]